MRYNVPLRSAIQHQLEELASTMQTWDAPLKVEQDEKDHILDSIQFFTHTTSCPKLTFAASAAGGDFPSLAYSSSFIYITLAQAVLYCADQISGLHEPAPSPEPLLHFTWLPDDPGLAKQALDHTLEALAGVSLQDVITASDYRNLKTEFGHPASPVALAADLIRPASTDSANLAIQFRATAELGTALQLLRGSASISYLLVSGTLSLPMVSRPNVSLFHEHLKRLCCVEARDRGIVFIALSRSHSFPSIELLEDLARRKQELREGQPAEQWYLRLPWLEHDGWELSLTRGRRLPPVGAVSYLIRFHRTTPVLRLDLDRIFWQEHILGSSPAETQANERRLFEDLDYSTHDQRSYGFPYPLQTCREHVNLTQSDRSTFRRQIIETAVRAGMKRTLFREVSSSFPSD